MANHLCAYHPPPGAQAADAWLAISYHHVLPFCLQELGASGLSKRPTSCMLVLPQPVKGAKPDDEEQKEFEKEYHEVEKKIKTAES